MTAYLDDDTMLLSATTAGKHPKDHFDFFPLTIDVEERMYAAGKIPGSFFRSEGRPGEDAILTCRLIDRPLRPTFKKGLRNEVQVVITVMALDPNVPYEYLWKLEQPAHAAANGYFLGAINRVGHEAPWNIGEFYGQSYFCDPRGQIIAQGPRDEDAVVVSDLNLEMIREVRNTWRFFRDRRPETYEALVAG